MKNSHLTQVQVTKILEKIARQKQENSLASFKPSMLRIINEQISQFKKAYNILLRNNPALCIFVQPEMPQNFFQGRPGQFQVAFSC